MAILFGAHRKAWQLTALVEQRVQVARTRFRIPDICVLTISAPRTPIVQEAPLLCIEILSPEDRLGRTFTRCEEYFAMGIREVWISDPAKRNVMVVRPGNVLETREGTLTLEGSAIAIPLSEVFAVLDQQYALWTAA